MMDFADARKVAQMLAALAEPTRLRIAYHLMQQPHYVSELAELLNVPMVNLSHHLGVMRQTGLLEDEKQGRRVIYKFRPEVLEPKNGENPLGVLKIGPLQVVFRSEFTLPALPARSRRRQTLR